MPTTTPNLLRYPASTDTPNVPRDVQRLAEDTELAIVGSKLPWFGKPYVESGGAITTPGGLFVAIAAGIACINGWRFAFLANASLAVVASTTNHVWLTQTLDGNGRHSGYTWTVLQTTAIPANSVYVGEVVTGGAAVTTMTASFRGVIAPGGLRSLTEYTADANAAGLTTGQVGWAEAVTIVGDGVTPIMLERFDPGVTVSSGGTMSHFFADPDWTGTQIAKSRTTLVAAALMPMIARRQAFTWLGRKTFTSYVSNDGGASPNTFTSQRSTSQRGHFRASFDF